MELRRLSLSFSLPDTHSLARTYIDVSTMNELELLLLEAEDQGVMSAAMAFIDFVENVSGSQVDSDPTIESSDDNSPSNLNDKPTAGPAKNASKKPRRKRKIKPGYSTEQGRRKKAEALALRAEVQSLGEWLKHLKSSISEPKAASLAAPRQNTYRTNTNRQTAIKTMEAFQKLQHAKSINRKLKAVLASHTKVGKSILETIQQTMALHV